MNLRAPRATASAVPSAVAPAAAAAPSAAAATASAARPAIRRPAVVIYTDGACKGNPGPGGWGAWLATADGHEKELCGGEALTTNNRMELTAVIEALASLKRTCDVTLHTDSEYVRKGITEWIHGWKQRGWTTADRKPVKNAELWQRLDALRMVHSVDWRWVRGHAGDPGNERADALANRGAAAFTRRGAGARPAA